MGRHKLTAIERSNGGKEGGKARARVLSKKRRQEIAQKAIRTRWRKIKGKE